MKITFFDSTSSEHQEYVTQQLGEHELRFLDVPAHEYFEESRDDVEIAVIFVSSRFSSEEFNNAPNLKYITTRSTGFDHVDLITAQQKGILVSNVPFYGSNTVAEHTMALLLALTRKIPESARRVKDGSFTYEGLQGVDLMGKTIGIVGGGHIGMNVAQMARGFGMRTLVYDLHHDQVLADQYGFDYADDLADLLGQSDVVSLHLPLNEHTQHIINSDNINQIKEGAFLINTARGGLIQTDALVKALNDGRIAGAGLDVLEGEEFLRDELSFLAEEHTEEEMRSVLEGHVLIEMDRVIITPHNAFNTKEAHFRNLQTTVDNIKQFIANEPTNLVTK